MVTITIETDNAVFDEYPEQEIARILRILAEKISSNILNDGMPVKDMNGNTVGKVEVK